MRYEWLERRREYGLFFIRLIIGFHLIYGTADNLFSQARMLEFRDFLASLGTPWPLVSAHVSAYAVHLRHPLHPRRIRPARGAGDDHQLHLRAAHRSSRRRVSAGCARADHVVLVGRIPDSWRGQTVMG